MCRFGGGGSRTAAKVADVSPDSSAPGGRPHLGTPPTPQSGGIMGCSKLLFPDMQLRFRGTVTSDMTRLGRTSTIGVSYMKGVVHTIRMPIRNELQAESYLLMRVGIDGVGGGARSSSFRGRAPLEVSKTTNCKENPMKYPSTQQFWPNFPRSSLLRAVHIENKPDGLGMGFDATRQ